MSCDTAPLCGCCDVDALRTPEARANPPEQPRLRGRIGTHASFLATMLARLGSHRMEPDGARPLADLTARDGDDPAVALLDVWASLADVLTFYQERILNEGYLRTAAERRSLLELARLAGYRLRPGVAAETHLAFTLEGQGERVVPAGTRVQSVPEPGADAQTFETREDLEARGGWNALRPRRRAPLRPSAAELATIETLWLAGNRTADLRANAPLLLVLNEDRPGSRTVRLRRVAEVTLEPGLPEGAALGPDRTRVRLHLPSAARVGAEARRAAERALADTVREAPANATGEEIAGLLEDALGRFDADPGSALTELRGELLPELRARRRAMPPGFTVLIPWLDRAIARLETAVASLPSEAGATRVVSERTDAGPRPFLEELLRPPSRPPASPRRLARDVRGAFPASGDAALRLLTRIEPRLATSLYPALRGLDDDEPGALSVHALTVEAPLFGHNAPRIPTYEVPDEPDGPEILAVGTTPSEGAQLLPPDRWEEWDLDEASATLHLDREYDALAPGSGGWLVLVGASEAGASGGSDAGGGALAFADVEAATASRSAYGLAGRATRLELPAGASWYDSESDAARDLSLVRGLTAVAGSAALELADAPIDAPVAGGAIDLEGIYDGLEGGRWLIVSGERELPGGGVAASEVAMLAAVEQHLSGDGDRDGHDVGDIDGDENDGGESDDGGANGEAGETGGSDDGVRRTTLHLAVPLAYRYRRDSVRVHANVAVASHGESVREPLGSSDGRTPLQRFELRQKPVTHVVASTPAGAESSLDVYVDDVRWQGASHLAALAPSQRGYLTERGDEEVTTVVFGDGARGAVPPGGSENLVARYRVGLGRGGNVAAESLTLLKDRPLGVQGVVNPLAASGGVDPDTVEQARRNAPLALATLGRLVSLRDYADFARAFAGIGRAVAARLPLGRRGTVHLTLAGHEDAPLDPDGSLLAALREAYRRWGDPRQPLTLEPRELRLLVISAGVRIRPDHRWETVEPALRAALTRAFGFERRELAQSVHASEVLAVMQGVRGVDWVDLDVLADLGEDEVADDPLAALGESLLERQTRATVRALPARLAPTAVVGAAGPATPRTLPAQLLLLHPDLPETLLLQEVTR